MGAGHSWCCSDSLSSLHSTATSLPSPTALYSFKSHSNVFPLHSFPRILQTHIPKSAHIAMSQSPSPTPLPLNCSRAAETHGEEGSIDAILDPHKIDPNLLQTLSYDALVWSSLRGLLVGDRNSQRSGSVPGVGLVHAPFALLPTSFPEGHWKQACEVAPIFNELVDRVSQDGEFLQETLSRTKKVDDFTSNLLDIHSKMLEINKKEEIRLGLHRSDYMLDEQTKLLLQIELNTISSSFPGLSCLVSELHRSLLQQHKKHLALDPDKIPKNNAVVRFVEALAKAWNEYNNPRAVVMFVVQTEERNMYDQHWLSSVLQERHHITTIRKTLAEIDALGELLPDGTLVVDGQVIAVVYFRAGYAPSDYHSESEWRARLLMEQSCAVKCPSISYHLAGTKKVQQELAKPNVLERFLENKDDISKLRKCFAGLWSLDESDVIKDAIQRPELYVMKPQREGGGNNIYGDDVREILEKLQKEGTGSDAAYILMQRIFPALSPAILMREGIPHKEQAISELGIYGAYLRNKTEVVINENCGYLMRTKVSSSNEGGVAAGFAVLDSIYLV
ncbi:glutathione synthetase, chloroplastic [Ipomoea triloba]|uniref:glutathione synthetase, chloroplastic n=1 Tax=Ipomoea triloba TaxID=35885 RepID=UPI00125D9A5C|nr:glutathione synthetase, chloroplastic [Ipomoea triloba]